MSLDTLKALTWDLVPFAVPSSHVEMVCKTVRVQARHLHGLTVVHELRQGGRGDGDEQNCAAVVDRLPPDAGNAQRCGHLRGGQLVSPATIDSSFSGSMWNRPQCVSTATPVNTPVGQPGGPWRRAEC